MKLSLHRFYASIFLLGLFVTAQVHADPIRIGVVDPTRIFKESNAAAAIQRKLQQEFAAREKTLVDQGAALKTMGEAFERESPTLSDADRTRRQKQLADRDFEFQRARRAMQEDIDARTNEEQQRLLEQTNLIVKQVAETEKFDLVLQAAVYVNPKNDLTGKVIQILNAQGPK